MAAFVVAYVCVYIVLVTLQNAAIILQVKEEKKSEDVKHNRMLLNFIGYLFWPVVLPLQLSIAFSSWLASEAEKNESGQKKKAEASSDESEYDSVMRMTQSRFKGFYKPFPPAQDNAAPESPLGSHSLD